MSPYLRVHQIRIAFGVILFALLSVSTPVRAQESFGKFPNDPVVKLDPDGTHVKLLREFSFIDDKNRTWLVPEGYTSDGASIPQPFWSFIGGPLNGNYRNASIVHDYFCDRRAHPWEQVHLAFYKGMRAGGVGPRLAWVMYKAVYYFGPRWEKKINVPEECQPGPKFKAEDCVLNSEPELVTYRNPITKDSFAQMLQELRTAGFGPEADELERVIKF